MRREIEEGRRQIGACDAVGSMREILPPGLTSDASGRGPIREERRTNNRPIELAGSNQLFHPREVFVRLPEDPADQIDRDPRTATFDRGDADGHQTPDARLLHSFQERAHRVTDDRRRSPPFWCDDGNDGVLSLDGPPDVIGFASIALDDRRQAVDAGEFRGPPSESGESIPSTKSLRQDELPRSAGRSDHGDSRFPVTCSFLLLRQRGSQCECLGRQDLLGAFDKEWTLEDARGALKADDVAWIAWKVDGSVTIELWPQDAPHAVRRLAHFLGREPTWHGLSRSGWNGKLTGLDWRILDSLIDAPPASIEEISAATGRSPKTVRT